MASRDRWVDVMVAAANRGALVRAPPEPSATPAAPPMAPPWAPGPGGQAHVTPIAESRGALLHGQAHHSSHWR